MITRRKTLALGAAAVVVPTPVQPDSAYLPISWVYDDTLIGQGSGTVDAILITMGDKVCIPVSMSLDNGVWERCE